MFPSIVNCIYSLVLVSVNEMVCVSDIWTYLFGIRSLVSFLNFEENLDSVFLTICTPLPSLFFFIQSPAIMIISRFWGKIQPCVFFSGPIALLLETEVLTGMVKNFVRQNNDHVHCSWKNVPRKYALQKIAPCKIDLRKIPLRKIDPESCPRKIAWNFSLFLIFIFRELFIFK